MPRHFLPRPANPPQRPGAAVLAGFLGWTLDAFDFFLVVMTLTAIGKEFHKTDAEMALSLTLTLAFRPVGALIFGLIADRYGAAIAADARSGFLFRSSKSSRGLRIAMRRF